MQPNESGEYEIGDTVSSSVFKALLDYYTTGTIKCPPGVSLSELRETCDYFLIPFNAENIVCENMGELMHELANLGAKDEFTELLENIITPVLVNACKKGERELRLGKYSKIVLMSYRGIPYNKTHFLYSWWFEMYLNRYFFFIYL